MHELVRFREVAEIIQKARRGAEGGKEIRFIGVNDVGADARSGGKPE